jgi:hypothetical protein
MSRKLLIIIAGLLLLIIGFAVGVVSVTYYDIRSYEITILDDATINLMNAEMMIGQFDRGDLEALNTSLNMAIDTEVIRIYQSLNLSNDEAKKERAKKLLSKVAKHRQAHPAPYARNPQDPEKEKVIKYVEAILSEHRGT